MGVFSSGVVGYVRELHDVNFNEPRQKTKDENGKVLWKKLSAVMRVKSFRLFMSESAED